MGSRTAGNKGWGTEVWTLKTGQVRMLQMRCVCKSKVGFLTFFFFFCHTVEHLGYSFPNQGWNPPTVEAQSLNHWTAREFPLAL